MKISLFKAFKLLCGRNARKPIYGLFISFELLAGQLSVYFLAVGDHKDQSILLQQVMLCQSCIHLSSKL